MMRFLISFILMIPSIFALSQDGWEWAPVGAQWTYTTYYGGEYLMYVTKDTIIMGIECKKFEVSELFPDCDGTDDRNMFMYWDNRRIYWLFENKFEKIYDFNLELNGNVDWMPFEGINCTGVVHTIDSVFLQTSMSIDFAVYEITSFPNYYFPFFHELFLSFVNPLPSLLVTHGLFFELQCYSDNQFTVNIDNTGLEPVAKFSDKCDFIVATDDLEEKNLRPKIFPTITRDYVEINSRVPINKYILYSVSGQFIDYQEFDSKTGNTSIDISLLSSGVYFLRLIDSEGRQFIEKIMKL